MVLLGESVRNEASLLYLQMLQDLEKDKEYLQSKLKQIPFEEAKKAYQEEQNRITEQQKLKRKLLLDRGISLDPYSFTDMLNFE